MINIKQFTNLKTPAASEEIQIDFPEPGNTYIYNRMIPEHSFTKMGYCCEPKGIGYPIYLEFSNNSSQGKRFYVGKTGMFEFQDEVWKDINESEEEYTASVTCYAVWVPKNIKFTLEYSYEE